MLDLSLKKPLNQIIINYTNEATEMKFTDELIKLKSDVYMSIPDKQRISKVITWTIQIIAKALLELLIDNNVDEVKIRDEVYEKQSQKNIFE